MCEEYRIDRAYGIIYRLNGNKSAYLFLCTFEQISAECKNRDSTIIKKINAWESMR